MKIDDPTFLVKLEQQFGPLLPYIWLKPENVDTITLANLISAIILRLVFNEDYTKIRDSFQHTERIMECMSYYGDLDFDRAKLRIIEPEERRFDAFYEDMINTGYIHTFEKFLLDEEEYRDEVLEQGHLTRNIVWYYCFRLENSMEENYFLITRKINEAMNSYGKRMGWNDKYGNLSVNFPTSVINSLEAEDQIKKFNNIYKKHLE